MSSDEIAIQVEDLSKCYQIYETPHDRLKQFLIPPLYRLIRKEPPRYYDEFWALRNVSFQIRKGETVGIVGRNGSGKSTLLQIICGTLFPTNGRVETNGRIAALLELGSGFNPDFTGRENVYMNAAIMGLSREEIDQRYDDIVTFADIGPFIDQPVKTYSSGMMVRLAFAVAINVDPEILVVDEALSVGDELFQRKCFSRIEAIKKSGATILFVSHSGATIVELCDRALLLDAGERLATATPKQIVGCYQKLLYAPAEKQEEVRVQIRQLNAGMETKKETRSPAAKSSKPESVVSETGLQERFDPELKPTSTIEYESHGAYIEEPMILTASGKRVNHLVRGRSYRYTYRVRFNQSATHVQFGMMIKTVSGVGLGGAISNRSPAGKIPMVAAGSVYQVEFHFNCLLNSGVYFLNAGVMGDVNGSECYLHRLIDIAMFRVLPDGNSYMTSFVDFGCLPEVRLIQG